MEYTTSIDVGVKQQWRSWPSPLGKNVEPKWVLPEGKDLCRVLHVRKDGDTSSETSEDSQEIFLSQDGMLYTKISSDEKDSLEGTSVLKLDEPLDSFETKFIDICTYHTFKNKIILITNSGKVFAVDGNNGKFLPNDIKYKDDFRLQKPLSHNEFTHCASGNDHIVLVDSNGKAWSTGKGPQTGQIAEHLKQNQSESCTTQEEISFTKIDFFQGLAVRSISCGADFSVALVERIEEDDDPSPSSPKHIKDKVCTDLASNNALRRISCPLGLPIENVVNEEHIFKEHDRRNLDQTNSIDNDDEIAEVQLRSKQADPLNDEADGEYATSGQDKNVERLAKSGIYMNPQDAFKFLSDQLSWIGSGIAASGEAHEDLSKGIKSNTPGIPEHEESNKDVGNDVAGESKRAETSNVSNIGRVAGNLVSAVGHTVVSRISKSFSMDSSNVPSPSNDSKTTMQTIIDTSISTKNEVQMNYVEDSTDGGMHMDSINQNKHLSDAVSLHDVQKVHDNIVESESISDEPQSMSTSSSNVEENAKNNESELIDDDANAFSNSKVDKTNALKDKNLLKAKQRFPLYWSSSSASKQKRHVSFQQHTRSASYEPDTAKEEKNNGFSKIRPTLGNSIENIVLNRSKKVFDIEVLVWGKGTRGQPGQGDMLDRLQPSTVNELSGKGVIKVVCGSKHCLGKYGLIIFKPEWLLLSMLSMN